MKTLKQPLATTLMQKLIQPMKNNPMIKLSTCLLATTMTFSSLAAQGCNDRVPASTPNSRFTVNSDNTVTDLATGLMWQRCTVGQSGTDCSGGRKKYLQWDNALKAAEESTVAGYSDWRLPNIKELTSILERRCYQPAMNLTIFPNTPDGRIYWSSSPFAQSNMSVWIAYTEYGYDYEENKRDYNLVRLVRNID